MAPEVSPEATPGHTLRGPFTRDDLSFTSRDEGGRLVNWNPKAHQDDALFAGGEAMGSAYFAEIVRLAWNNQHEAYNAIRFALQSKNWRGSWGEESGFANVLAAYAMTGIAAVEDGAQLFDELRGELNALRLQCSVSEMQLRELGVVPWRNWGEAEAASKQGKSDKR